MDADIEALCKRLRGEFNACCYRDDCTSALPPYIKEMVDA